MGISSTFINANMPRDFYDQQILYENEGLIQLTPEQELRRRRTNLDNNGRRDTSFFTEAEVQYILSDTPVSVQEAKRSKDSQSQKGPSFQEIIENLQKQSEPDIVTGEDSKKGSAEFDMLEFEVYDFE